jgi:ELWxxDGT repeat protein
VRLAIGISVAAAVLLLSTGGLAQGPAFLVKDIDTGPDGVSSTPMHLTRAGNAVFFTANDGMRGRELWKTDGTTGGTILVKDIGPPTSSSEPYNFSASNGLVYFSAFEPPDNFGWWRSDGTQAGTLRIADGGGGCLTSVGDTTFFASSSALWKTDGTAAGTGLVKEIGGPIANLTDVAGVLFFFADDHEHGLELWRSDGTAAGTRLIKDINPGPTDSNLNPSCGFDGVDRSFVFVEIDGTLYCCDRRRAWDRVLEKRRDGKGDRHGARHSTGPGGGLTEAAHGG